MALNIVKEVVKLKEMTLEELREKYAEVFGNAREIFDSSSHRLESVPDDVYLAEDPQVHNAYIAGYLGYLKLEALAGYSESSDVRLELDRLLVLRAAGFDKDVPWTGRDYRRVLTIARNFTYLVPELGQYLQDNAFERVREAVIEYEYVAPYQFLSKAEDGFAEFVINPLYNYEAMFQAKALILGASREELLKCLDVPACERGDLFYIRNLVATIEAPHSLEKSASVSFGDQGTPVTYVLSFSGGGDALVLTDTLAPGLGVPRDFEIEGTSTLPTYDGREHVLTWSGTPSPGEMVVIRYTVTITAGDCRWLVNTAELNSGGDEPSVASATVTANCVLNFLPLICRQ